MSTVRFVSLAVCVALLLSVGHARASEDKLTMKDKDFIKSAMRQMEIIAQESRLADTNADSDGVKHFANMATHDMDSMIKSLHEFCDKNNWSFDADPTRPDVKGKHELEGLKGKEFDRVYMSDMTREFEETLKDFKTAADQADNSELRQWFERYDNKVHDRRDNANELYRKVKGKD